MPGVVFVGDPEGSTILWGGRGRGFVRAPKEQVGQSLVPRVRGKADPQRLQMVTQYDMGWAANMSSARGVPC